MYPSSLRIRAISIFSREAGTSTFAWRAETAFRTRVSMSAMGSAVIVSYSAPFIVLSSIQPALGQSYLPTSLGDARNLARQRQLPEADPAQGKLAEKAARTSAGLTTVSQPHLEFRLLQFFRDFCSGCHRFTLLVSVA